MINKFVPQSPDLLLDNDPAMTLAKFGHINAIVNEVNKVTGNTLTVTQTVAISSAVTIDSYAGIITTVSATTAAGSNVAFTVNNSKVTTTSKVLLTPIHVGAGIPVFTLDSVSNGSFVIRIYNVHPTNAFNNIFKINFLVLD
jgi:hypothetical protein